MVQINAVSLKVCGKTFAMLKTVCADDLGQFTRNFLSVAATFPVQHLKFLEPTWLKQFKVKKQHINNTKNIAHNGEKNFPNTKNNVEKKRQ